MAKKVTQFCYVCGERLRLRYPGGDPENGPAQMSCLDEEHVPLAELLKDAQSELADDLFDSVIQCIEKHLETCGEGVMEGAKFEALRSLRKDIIEGLMEMPEEAYDAMMAANSCCSGTGGFHDDTCSRTVKLSSSGEDNA